MTRSLILITLLSVNAMSLAAEPVNIGSRRELFVDDALVERLVGRAVNYRCQARDTDTATAFARWFSRRTHGAGPQSHSQRRFRPESDSRRDCVDAGDQ